MADLGMGGAQRVASILINAWAGRGDEVTLLSLGRLDEVSFFPLSERVTVIPLGLQGRGRGSVSDNVNRLDVLRRKIKELSPDIVISFMSETNVLVRIATFGLGIPVIVSERDNPYQSLITRPWRILRALVYPFVTKLVCQTKEAKLFFGPCVPSVVIPNPLLVEGTMEKEKEIKENLRVISLGRLVEGKKFDDLIHAFSKVCVTNPNVSLTILGEGPERPALEKLISHLGLAGRVFLPGHDSSPLEQVKRADIFVLSSEGEGFPNALFESMSLGLACISSDCSPSISEWVVPEKNALVYPVGDVSALVKLLSRVLEDEPLRRALAEEGKKISQRLSLPSILSQWDEVFRSVSENSACRP